MIMAFCCWGRRDKSENADPADQASRLVVGWTTMMISAKASTS
jgi:hypothetical protein